MLDLNSIDGNTYTVAQDDTNGKLIFSYTGTSTSVQFNDTGSTMFPLLGLEEGTDHSFTTVSPLVAQKVSFLLRNTYLKLKISGNNFTIDNAYNHRGVDNTLAIVPITADI